MEVELGAAVGVGGVDPLMAAEEPVAGVAAGCWSVTSPHSVYINFKLESQGILRLVTWPGADLDSWRYIAF